MEAGYESVLAGLMKRSDEKFIVTGQGADEVFYGYSKFTDGREYSNEESLRILHNKTLPRERKISSYFGKKLITPYLDEEIVKLFSKLPLEMHLSKNGQRKKILREEAVLAGFNIEFSGNKKLAAQYGSGFQKAISRAASHGILKFGGAQVEIR
ncbi:MAG: asparagine synthase C-terminal domain-containing protein [Thermoplasmataceae archaeon]